MKQIAAGILVLLFLWSGAAAAEERKEEWHERDFRFSALRNVDYQISGVEELKLEEIDRRKLEDVLDGSFAAAKAGHVQWLSQKQLQERIYKSVQSDLAALKRDDPEQYQLRWNELLPKAVDAHLTVKVRQWGYIQVYVPETTETYTEYRSTPIHVVQYDANGNAKTVVQWVEIPIERVRIIPAHYEPLAQAGLEFVLTDANSGQKIWMLLDMREARGGKTPADMAGRIVSRLIEQLTELQNKTK